MQTTRSAPLWRQLAAMTYDGLIVVALLMLLTASILLARGGIAFDPASAWFRAALVAAVWAYFAWSWTHGGQTVGMRAWRLRLRQTDRMVVGLGAATVRFLAAALSAAAIGLGYVWCLIDASGRSWHDRISGTHLEYQERLAKPGDGKERHE